MGYVPGKGLGKHGTGIAEPISESSNKGRHGLGYLLEGLEREDVKWEEEEVSFQVVLLLCVFLKALHKSYVFHVISCLLVGTFAHMYFFVYIRIITG